MQHVASDSQAAPTEKKEESKTTFFGMAGVMLPLLTTVHAGGIMVLLQNIPDPTLETKIAIYAVFGASLLLTVGQDMEAYLRRRFRRKSSV